ncbi:TPA: glycosyltransferase [Kluyvera ascorbata F0526]|nr:glycosyltransferase [Kluyvera ascorbata F0526]
MNITSLIVTYNRLDKLKKTIQATLALPFNHIVVVNNASSDGTSEWLKQNSDERLIVISRRVNSGGAGGFKHGSEWIVGNLKTDWILFYDDDAYPESDFFEKITNSNISENKVYACNVIDTSGIRCGMNIPWKKYPRGLFSHLRYQANPHEFISSGVDSERIISLSFVGMLIGFENLKAYFPYMDERLFIYFDDIYFSYHLYLNNIIMEFNPGLNIVHDIDTSNKYMASWKVYYLIRNMLFADKIFGVKTPFSRVYLLSRLLKYSLLSINHPDRKSYIKKFIQGLRDGICYRIRER